jgi:hypothetical protein
MLRGSFAVLSVLAALLIPSLATASSVERVRVAGPGVTSAFPRGLSLELTSPPAYARSSAGAAQGSWIGPGYWASGNGSVGGKASIRWSVGFQATKASARAVALAAPTHGFPLDKRDPLSVPHYVGKRVVGTLLGFYVIMHAAAPNDGSYEAALAFPVAPGAFAIVRFEFLDPASNSAGQWGNYLVGGLDPPSVWNRGQTFWALSGVKLLGNLPPTRVEVGVSGRRVRGTVLDAFRHPVLRVPVSLQRRIGSSWRVQTSTKTNSRGLFSVRGLKRGSYRAVVVSSSKKTVASRAVYVG